MLERIIERVVKELREMTIIIPLDEDYPEFGQFVIFIPLVIGWILSKIL